MENQTNQQQKIQHIKETVDKLKNLDLPSTVKTNETLEHVKNTTLFENTHLSNTGNVVAEDIKNVISTTQHLLDSKNKDDHLQKLIFHSNKATNFTNTATFSKTNLKSEAGDISQNLSLSYSSISDIVKLLISSSVFRNAFVDLGNILLEILKFNLGSSTFKNAGSSGTPTQGYKEVVNELNNTVAGESSMRSAAHNIVDIVSDTTASTIPENVKNKLGDAVQPHLNDKNKSTKVAFKDAAKDTYAVVKEKAYEFEIPQEHLDSIIDRLVNALKVFAKEQQFQDAINSFFTAITGFFESSKTFSKSQYTKGKMVLKEPSLSGRSAESEWEIAMTHAKILVENIFGGKSMSDVFSAFMVLFQDIQNDQALIDKFQKWRDLVMNMFNDPEKITQESFRNEISYLSKHTVKSVTDSYSDQAENIYMTLSDFLSGITTDPVNIEFMDSIKKLSSDLFLDDSGNLTIKTELAGDLYQILPIVSEKISYIPVPKFSFENNDYSISLDNIVLKCNGLIPSQINILISAALNMQAPKLTGELAFAVSKIQVSAENISFVFAKKTGFPKFHDSGLVSFNLYKDGLSLDLGFTPWIQTSESLDPNTNLPVISKGLDVTNCHSSLDKLKINFSQTQRHHLVYKIFKNSIQKIAKVQIAHIIENNLKSILENKKAASD